MGETMTEHVDGICTALAELPEGALLTKAALAKILGKCEKTIDRMVERGELPRSVRMNGKATWTAGAVLGHIEERLREAKHQAEKERRRIAQYSP